MGQAELERITVEFPEFIELLKRGHKISVGELKLVGRKECPTRSYPVFVDGEGGIHLNEIYSIDGKKVVSKTAGVSREFALELFPDVDIPYDVGHVILISSIDEGEVVRKDNYDIPFP